MTPSIAWAVIVVCCSLLSLVVLNRFLGTWACRIMGWHLAPKQQSFDGCSFEGQCPRCGKKVRQDSQGNWFEVSP